LQLILNTFGTFLGKDGNCFLIKADDKFRKVSARKIESILISAGANLTSDAIELAIGNNIDIVFANKYGDPFARIWHPKLGSVTTIRRKQIELYNKNEGLDFALIWIRRKFNNQINFLKELKTRRKLKEEEIDKRINTLCKLSEKLDKLSGTIEEKRSTIMGLEGTAGKTYFDTLNFLLPEQFKFDGRSKQPAKDPFNCMLNYAYGVLYSRVEKACIIAGLEPYSGFIHTDNYGKKSLVFDLIENYRILAERTVFYLFSKRQIKNEYFDPIKGGITLNKEGKATLIPEITNELDRKIKYKGRNISQGDIIQFDCFQFAKKLLEV